MSEAISIRSESSFGKNDLCFFGILSGQSVLNAPAASAVPLTRAVLLSGTALAAGSSTN